MVGCAAPAKPTDIAATTLPVYEFTARLCQGTGITVTRLISESVSCLHDYSLSVAQVKALEAAQVTVLSGSGLEDHLEGITGKTIDASAGISLLESCAHHDHDRHDNHDADPHMWLSPEYAKAMAKNICSGLKQQFPAHSAVFEGNLAALLSDLDELQKYGEQTLSQLSCRKLVTFHDGFAYFAHAFSLEILESVEEESGSEASASELKELITLVREHQLPAIFTETNGSVSAADVIAAETGVRIFRLDMAMSGHSYFEAMYHNIDTLKEALG